MKTFICTQELLAEPYNSIQGTKEPVLLALLVLEMNTVFPSPKCEMGSNIVPK